MRSPKGKYGGKFKKISARKNRIIIDLRIKGLSLNDIVDHFRQAYRIKITVYYIKKLIKNPDTISNFINHAIDIRIKTLETKYMSDFIYYLGLPTLAFLGMVFISLTFPTWFFSILTGVIGLYIIILFFLFYNKYRGKKK